MLHVTGIYLHEPCLLHGTLILTRTYTRLTLSQAYVATDPIQYLIPEIGYIINTTQCLCDSMVELADKIHSPIEHDCAANDDCNGVLCVADVFSDTYLLEFLILSCEDPPALDILLEDGDGNALFSAVVTDTYYGTLPAGDFVILLQANVVHYNYSMDIQVSIGHINYTIKWSNMHVTLVKR